MNSSFHEVTAEQNADLRGDLHALCYNSTVTVQGPIGDGGVQGCRHDLAVILRHCGNVLRCRK